MASSSTTAQKLQEKVFAASANVNAMLSNSPASAIDPALKINIPKASPPIFGRHRPHGTNGNANGDTQGQVNVPIDAEAAPGFPADDVVEDDLSDAKTYMQKLQTKLGDDYEGVELFRLKQDAERSKHWKRWGPYLSERQWATVREDYSANGDAWTHFPHEHARSRAYRWGEDGIAGVSDNRARICFSLALWNEKDRMLKERLFGVTGHQGNHGEDVKELYYYLDSTPTHSYMKMLYKYPQAPYPYEELVAESQRRSRDEPEYEIMDTGIFNENRYWDIFVEYAKDATRPDAMAVRITAYNRGPDPATLHIIPQFFFPNTWSWPLPEPKRPEMKQVLEPTDSQPGIVRCDQPTLGVTHFYVLPSPPAVGPIRDGETVEVEGESIVPELLFTENDTNFERLYNVNNKSAYVKDAFHDHIIHSHRPQCRSKTPTPSGASTSDAASISDSASTSDAASTSDDASTPDNASTQEEERAFVNPEKVGTKAGAHYTFRDVPGNGGCAVVRLKMTPHSPQGDRALNDEEAFDAIIDDRRNEADEFYGSVLPGSLTEDLKQVARQAFSGMMWTKQMYRFIQDEWLNGDPAQPPPPPERQWIRNRLWKHLHIEDVLSMPDKWEYPFFAAWDTAFHAIPLAIIDPEFAKRQLDLLTREWYMKPDGALPAYEWDFSDVNPPVHAWATFRVFKIERKLYGREDLQFLERVFQKLLLNFTWWVNRKDEGGNDVFGGGFLGLDNIGVFNRSEPLPTGGELRQADGTAWMAFYSLNMLNMALELAKHNLVYEDIASKFFEHFIYIADAMTFRAADGDQSLWNEEDGFYYDAIHFGPGQSYQMAVHSLVGLIPLYATLTLEPSVINRFPGFKKRMNWFIENRADMVNRNTANLEQRGRGDRRLLALANKDRLERILRRMLDEEEFFSDHGIRSLSRYHLEHPYEMDANYQHYEVGYWPGDSHSGMFGGNSNWRGPVWLAVNFLLIESLQRFHQYYGPEFQVECPTGSGDMMDLGKVAEEIQHRIIHIFGRDEEGRRAVNGNNEVLNRDPYFRDYVNFYEYFHGDSGSGIGASHQTGWTGLVAFHIMQSGITCRLPKTPRTPGALARHYFDEQIDATSDYGDEQSLFSTFSYYSAAEESILGDLSPDVL
ncbi:Six-hairpin glycosidase-like protein [Auriculariales sp. MPI-PUGE-AT-0066]|nr:Six-hairpin glycosidase-like protein [Auriculariales sp. MPI-PUGE-AT-0066]